MKRTEKEKSKAREAEEKEDQEDSRECETCGKDISDETGGEFFYCTSSGEYHCEGCAAKKEKCDAEGCDMCDHD